MRHWVSAESGDQRPVRNAELPVAPVTAALCAPTEPFGALGMPSDLNWVSDRPVAPEVGHTSRFPSLQAYGTGQGVWGRDLEKPCEQSGETSVR